MKSKIMMICNLIISCFIIVLILFSTCPQKRRILSDAYTKYVVSFLGDSITEQCKKNYGFIQMVDNNFDFKKVNNYGKYGTTICNEKRFDSFFQDYRVNQIDCNSDFIFVYGGLNDCSCQYPIGEKDSFDVNCFIGAYNTLITKLKERFNAEIVLIIPHYVEIEGIQNYCSAIVEISKKNNVDYIDLYTNAEITHETLNYYTIDGIHLNINGASKVANCISNYLLERDERNDYKKNIFKTW